MKKITIAVLGILAALLVSGGGAVAQSPAQIAEQFAKAYYTWDLPTCERLMGPYYEDSQIEFAQDLFTDYAHESIGKIMGEYTFTVKYNAGESEVGSESADIVFDTTVDADGNASGQSRVQLNKMGGTWCVQSFDLWMEEGVQRKMQQAMMQM